MEPIRDPVLQRKAQETFDLFRTAEAIMRQNLRRRHPDASEEEIDQRLFDWLRERPGAEFGDAAGRPVAWPERSG